MTQSSTQQTVGATTLKRLRVVMLINGYYPLIGGAERILTALSPALEQAGVEVVVITRRYPGLKAFERVDNIPVYRLPIPGPKAFASIAFTGAALRLIKRLKPDVVHAHDLFSTATTAMLAKRLTKTPFVCTIHGGGNCFDLQRLDSKLFGKQRWQTFVNNIDRFIVISSEIDRALAQRNVPARLRESISNGVDTESFCPLLHEKKANLRRALGLGEGPVVVFTGRLVPGKRVGLLVSVWENLIQEFPHAQLLVVGDGPEGESLRARNTPGVTFTGSVDNVRPYLQSADIFVLPSIAEGLSVAALEAQSVGLATLLTDTGGASDIVTHGQNGWLITPDDAQALHAGLRALLVDAQLRVRLGEQARLNVIERFSLSGVAARLKALYASLGEARDEHETAGDYTVARIEATERP